jgi:ABC-type phosphate transport system substrate-binding protein
MNRFTTYRYRLGLLGIGFALSLGVNAGAHADVVAVVSAKSALKSLSKRQIADIFLGRQIRYPDGQVAVPVDQAVGATSRDEFYASFAALSPEQLKAHWAKIVFTGRGKPPKAVASAAEVKKLIGADPLTIGYLDRSAVDDSVKVLAPP